jgi:predicted DNA binding CopG/RHH family protein
MRKSTKPKKLPTFASDEEAERFVDEADLSEYDLAGGKFVRFELKPKDAQVNLRLPASLLDAVRVRAKRAGVPYQRFIRLALERAVEAKRR